MGYYNLVYEWEGDQTQPFSENFIWKSKRFLFPKRFTFNCFVVIADTGDRADWYATLLEYRAILKRNAAKIANQDDGGLISEGMPGDDLSINGDYLEDLPSLGAYSGDLELTFMFYVNGTLIHTADIYATDVPERLPDGVRGRSFEIEITGNVDRVRSIMAASSMEELQIIESQED